MVLTKKIDAEKVFLCCEKFFEKVSTFPKNSIEKVLLCYEKSLEKVDCFLYTIKRF